MDFLIQLILSDISGEKNFLINKFFNSVLLTQSSQDILLPGNSGTLEIAEEMVSDYSPVDGVERLL
jgi:hypothetical protein